MSSNSSAPLKTLLYLSCAGLLVVFSNCTSPKDNAAHVTASHATPAPAATPLHVAPPAPTSETRPGSVDRRARVATQLSPDDVLNLADLCVRQNRRNFQDYVVANVSLNLNLGLHPDSDQSKIMWVVSYREFDGSAQYKTNDVAFWVYVDDTTKSARFRGMP